MHFLEKQLVIGGTHTAKKQLVIGGTDTAKKQLVIGGTHTAKKLVRTGSRKFKQSGPRLTLVWVTIQGLPRKLQLQIL